MRHMAVTRSAGDTLTAGAGRIHDRLDRVPSLWRHRCYRQGDGTRWKREDPWVPLWRPPPIRVTSGRSSPSVPGEDVLVGGPQRGGDRSFARFGIAVGRDAQVLLAKLAHEPLPHQGPTLLQHPRGYAQLLARREVGAAPDPQLHEDGNQRDGLLGEGVDRLLLVGGIRSFGYHLLFGEPSDAVRKDVRGNALLRVQELAEMPFASEHHVAEDQKAPSVPQYFEGEVDRATRAVFVSHLSDPRKLVVAE